MVTQGGEKPNRKAGARRHGSKPSVIDNATTDNKDK